MDDPDKTFSSALDHELEKICQFYRSKEQEVYAELESLLKEVEEYLEENEDLDGEEHDDGPPPSRQTNKSTGRKGSVFNGFGFGKRRRSTVSRPSLAEEDESDEDADERSALRKTNSKNRRNSRGEEHMSGSGMMSSSAILGRRRRSLAFDDENDMSFAVLYDSVISLKKRTISLYVNICELRSYIQLNKTGFSKVLKKYDKILDRNLKSTYIEQNVDPAYPFQQRVMDNLADNLSKIERTYANLCTQGDLPTAKRELRLHLREHVVWERNTVWREMIGIERKAQAANLGIRQTILGRDTDPKGRLQGDEDQVGMKEIRTPVGRYTCPRWLLSSTFYTIIAILAVFAVLLFVPIMKEPEQQNCLALVVLVSLLWATEVSDIEQIP